MSQLHHSRREWAQVLVPCCSERGGHIGVPQAVDRHDDMHVVDLLVACWGAARAVLGVASALVFALALVNVVHLRHRTLE
jgi:hypothetical protein